MRARATTRGRLVKSHGLTSNSSIDEYSVDALRIAVCGGLGGSLLNSKLARLTRWIGVLGLVLVEFCMFT